MYTYVTFVVPSKSMCSMVRAHLTGHHKSRGFTPLRTFKFSSTALKAYKYTVHEKSLLNPAIYWQKNKYKKLPVSLDIPKSDIFNLFALSRRQFLAAKSRWMHPFSSKYAIPDAASIANCRSSPCSDS